MLFDLRSAGRRRLVKAVYVTLAFLMGGGLILFGIGGDVSGGLVDAITERGGGGDDGTERQQQREEAALAATRARPTDVAAWAALTRAQVQLAGQGDNFDPAKGTYTASGRAKLAQAERSWNKYLALDPPNPDERLARLMVQAFDALGKPAEAARAQEIVAEARPKSANVFATLAVYAYAAGQTRKGDLARDKALELTPKDQREALRGQLEQARNTGAASASQGSG